jgi:hypothetical protein
MPKFIKYEHHGKKVWVRDDLKGTHWEICLCYKCSNFYPDSREKNCSIANELFQECLKFNVVIPVLECPKFELYPTFEFLSNQKLSD